MVYIIPSELSEGFLLAKTEPSALTGTSSSQQLLQQKAHSWVEDDSDATRSIFEKILSLINFEFVLEYKPYAQVLQPCISLLVIALSIDSFCLDVALPFQTALQLDRPGQRNRR